MDRENALEIIEKMKELLYDFEAIVRFKGSHMDMERFRQYPKGHILMALTNDHDYMGGCHFNLEALVDDIFPVKEEEIEEEEEITEI